MPVVVVFVMMAVAVVLVVLIVMNWRSISQFLCPKETLTQHLKEVSQDLQLSHALMSLRTECVWTRNHCVSCLLRPCW